MAKKQIPSSDTEASAPLHIPSEAAERFFNSFERSARRWEMIIYPGMIILVMFMAYGFYMIYNLTSDMRTMVARFDDPQIVKNLSGISTAMQSLSIDIRQMTDKVEGMSKDTSSMSASTGEMAKLMKSVEYMKSIDTELKKMNQTIYVMGGNVSYLRRDMANMNRSISRPMGMLNSVLPF